MPIGFNVGLDIGSLISAFAGPSVSHQLSKQHHYAKRAAAEIPGIEIPARAKAARAAGLSPLAVLGSGGAGLYTPSPRPPIRGMRAGASYDPNERRRLALSKEELKQRGQIENRRLDIEQKKLDLMVLEARNRTVAAEAKKRLQAPGPTSYGDAAGKYGMMVGEAYGLGNLIYDLIRGGRTAAPTFKGMAIMGGMKPRKKRKGRR